MHVSTVSPLEHTAFHHKSSRNRPLSTFLSPARQLIVGKRPLRLRRKRGNGFRSVNGSRFRSWVGGGGAPVQLSMRTAPAGSAWEASGKKRLGRHRAARDCGTKSRFLFVRHVLQDSRSPGAAAERGRPGHSPSMSFEKDGTL